MNLSPIWICVAWAASITVIVWAFARALKRQRREVRADILCPLRKVKLTAHEAFYGHCFNCPFNNVKDCGDRFGKEQLKQPYVKG